MIRKYGFRQFCFELFVIVPILAICGAVIGASVGILMGGKMNHNHEEVVHTERVGKFDISLYFAPEDTEPDWNMTTGERTELMTKIDNSTLLWFVAHVVASKNGVELGSDYLGGCCYSSVAEFLEPGGCYEDMKREAIACATNALAELCK